MTGFEKIYKACLSDVFRYTRRLTGDENLTEEITSETFLKAMESIDRFRGDCDIRVWLCQIAKNTYYSYLKKTRPISEDLNGEEIALLQATDNIEEMIADKDDAMYIHTVLHDLAEPYKEVFMLRVFSEPGFAQIGRM